MDLRNIVQEIRLSGPPGPESLDPSGNSLGIVTADNRLNIALTLCKIFELLKDRLKAMYTKCMCLFWVVFYSSDGGGDRILTKVHLYIVGKFCTAEVTPKNVLHRRLMF